MLEEYLTHIRAGGAPETTVRTRRSQIGRALRAMGKPPQDVTLDDLVSYLSRQEWKPETRKGARSALHAFFDWAYDTERIATDPTRKLPKVTVPAGKPRPTPSGVFDAALARASERDRLMILLAAHAGLRRSEIAKVHSQDLDGARLRVLGKGGKTRIIPLIPQLRDALAQSDGFIFPGRVDGHLSPDRVGKILRAHLGEHWSGHTLRHRFATHAYARTTNILAVRDLLGHSSVATTQRYTAVDDQALWDAVGVHVVNP